MSVADSSFDTWLDGYVAGAPNRKTSIYVEGSMIALICDVKIMKATNNLASLNDVMRNLYEKFALKGIGYTEEDYKIELELVAGESFDQIFKDLVYGTVDYESYLIESMAYLGIKLEGKPSLIKTHAQLGVKCLEENNQTVVKIIYPGSIFDTANIMLEDKIIAINGMAVTGNFEKWFRYFQKEKTLVLTIDRGGRILEIEIPLGDQVYFKNYQLSKMKNETALQKESYNFWIK
jgi:predicted metalloprotease with PDZ domain